MQPPETDLRLLLLTSSYWPEHSPPQRRWMSLIRTMRDQGWRVSVVAPVAHYGPGPDYNSETKGRAWRAQPGFLGEKIYRVPHLFLGDNRICKLANQLIGAAGSVVRGIATGRQDAVVVTAPSLPLLGSALLVARMKGLPLVVEMRDAWPNLAQDASLVRGGSKSVINSAVEYVQNRADLVVTVTEGFAQTLRDRGVHNVVTVRNGILMDRTPKLQAPPSDRDRLEVLYLGNHGESQALDVLIRAATLVGEDMRLTLVGHGSQKPALRRLAMELGVKVRFLPPEYREAVFSRYEEADSLVISLRDDWKSFEDTIPSKTYEVLAIGRHITGIVRGEAANVLTGAGEGDIVECNPQGIAELWRELAADRARLQPAGTGREWVKEHAEYSDLACQYGDLLRETIREHRSQPQQSLTQRIARVGRAAVQVSRQLRHARSTA